MEILFLGTGHAISTRCYNTCYVLRQNERYLLVDGGGGNGILRQLQPVSPGRRLRTSL